MNTTIKIKFNLPDNAIDIPLFDGRYKATEDGKIWTVPGHKSYKIDRMLKPGMTKNGYMSLSLGRDETHLVHRLIATTFIENPNKKPCVNHKNGNKADNRACNLEWATYSENEKHSYRVLGKKPNKPNLGKLGIKARDGKPVFGIGITDRKTYLFGSASEAGRNGFQQAWVSSCARGETRHHKQVVWEYITKEEYFKKLEEGV